MKSIDTDKQQFISGYKNEYKGALTTVLVRDFDKDYFSAFYFIITDIYQ
jgi:hypothetical protein